jgi:PIN domain nuclease of toxin-antitoxin system
VNYLLDTHVLLWAAGDPDRISAPVRALLEDAVNTLHFSAASLWEIVLKKALGRDDFRVDPVRLRRLLVANGWNELAVASDHALAVGALPPLHRDPFDRILLAQARSEGLQLITADRQLQQYGDGIVAA